MLGGNGRGQHGFVGSKWGGVQAGHSCMPFYPVKQVLPLVYDFSEIFIWRKFVSYGNSHMYFSCRYTNLFYNFIVCKNLAIPFILGLDFLRTHEIGLQWRDAGEMMITNKFLLSTETSISGLSAMICIFNIFLHCNFKLNWHSIHLFTLVFYSFM